MLPVPRHRRWVPFIARAGMVRSSAPPALPAPFQLSIRGKPRNAAFGFRPRLRGRVFGLAGLVAACPGPGASPEALQAFARCAALS